ncbi:hypothetical protein A1O1_07860 [Capronia coronata CBS 617.96]|uniref:DUF3445 domain-containing protein n=1 Tax=Capronia coronata CBS 617.96 TaxID=1182541 RepID=W9XWQ7_9EURO|nr:uncharacterized protein A1O1_07860 [Capronia coronata CBS 617.96]EXJ81795.1 hypothetical protein A1O1_07860 [Capronia coronata CBS 617.96]
MGWSKLSTMLAGSTGKPLDTSDHKKTVITDQWQYPPVTANASFDLETTPIPAFRAFRYSYKRHTIDVKKLDLNDWILLDNQFPRYHSAKVARLAERGDKIVGTLPCATDAARELCQDLAEFLSSRYPQVYRITRSGSDKDGWLGKGSITRVEMPSLGASYDLVNEDPMTVAGLLQPTDLNILTKRPDGQYQLSAVMFGIGGGQRLKDKLGRSLADLHYGGQVPHFKEQLQVPLDRFLSKLKVDGPIVRHTTALTIHDELHWPEVTMGPEDDWDPVIRGPAIGSKGATTFKPPHPILDISSLWHRTERQTLRRLPKSGTIVWSVHTYVNPLASILKEPGIPGRLASLVRSWDDELAAHKGRHLYADVLLPHLDALHSEQVSAGVCADEPTTLPNFPF